MRTLESRYLRIGHGWCEEFRKAKVAYAVGKVVVLTYSEVASSNLRELHHGNDRHLLDDRNFQSPSPAIDVATIAKTIERYVPDIPVFRKDTDAFVAAEAPFVRAVS